MNSWSKATLKLVRETNYLDQLQKIYSHEEGERSITHATLDAIREAFNDGDADSLLNQLLSLEKFPYKDSYVGFLRKDRTAIQRNPETVQRIMDRLNKMGIENVLAGAMQAKEANTRRGNQFRYWRNTLGFPTVSLDEFRASINGILLLGGNELAALDFCNVVLKLGITKRPDLVVKVNRKYVVGEAKFLSQTGSNQSRAFDDGMKLATNATGNAYKVFILDGVHWIQTGSEQYQRIEHSNAAIFSALLIKDYLVSLLD